MVSLVLLNQAQVLQQNLLRSVVTMGCLPAALGRRYQPVRAKALPAFDAHDQTPAGVSKWSSLACGQSQHALLLPELVGHLQCKHTVIGALMNSIQLATWPRAALQLACNIATAAGESTQTSLQHELAADCDVDVTRQVQQGHGCTISTTDLGQGSVCR